MAPLDPVFESISLLARCVTLWIGPSLGPVERACLQSVLRQGHTVALYCYHVPEGVPGGVELREAAGILPEADIVRHRSGSVSLFSNRFRYELQRRGLGTWVDTDIYLLKPLDGECPYLMGEEAPGVINTGVLRLPPDSPLLAPLLEIFKEKTVPRWLPLRARAAAWWRLRTRGRSGVADMPWGSAGPRALTALAQHFGLAHLAEPAEVLNPAPWQDAGWVRDPARRLEDMVTERTVAVHLWNERIKRFKNAPAPAGTFLARLQAEGAAGSRGALPQAAAAQ
ncbi:MAG TPA: hypothetical protein VGB70_08295 [Allosphingosinicella sp.]